MIKSIEYCSITGWAEQAETVQEHHERKYLDPSFFALLIIVAFGSFYEGSYRLFANLYFALYLDYLLPLPSPEALHIGGIIIICGYIILYFNLGNVRTGLSINLDPEKWPADNGPFNVLGASLKEIMTVLASVRAARRVTFSRVNRWKFLDKILRLVRLFSTPIASLGLIIILFVPSRLPAPETRVQFIDEDVFYISIAAALAVISHVALRMLRPRAVDVLKSDYRPPIILLRSFEADTEKISGHLHGQSKLTLEEAIAEQIESYGPFIAVGKPGEFWPHAGASRAYLPDETWRSQVIQWIVNTELIIAIAGDSDWLLWELCQVFASSRERRTIILFPPADSARSLVKLKSIFEALGLMPQWPNVDQSNIENYRAAVFCENGQLLFLTSESAHEKDYELAVQLCIYACLSARK